MSVYDQLKALSIDLPSPAIPAAAYVPYVQSGNLVYLSGHIARKDGKVWAGQLGRDLQTADGQQAARAIAIDLMGTLQHAAGGDLNRVRRIVKLMCLVNSTGDYTEQHLVANGCSELLGQVFGDRGTHARSAFGVSQIPLGSCVEIELIAELACPGPRNAPSARPRRRALPPRAAGLRAARPWRACCAARAWPMPAAVPQPRTAQACAGPPPGPA